MADEIVVTGVLTGDGWDTLFLAHPDETVEELGAPSTPAGLAQVALAELSHFYGIPISEGEMKRLLVEERAERKGSKR